MRGFGVRVLSAPIVVGVCLSLLASVVPAQAALPVAASEVEQSAPPADDPVKDALAAAKASGKPVPVPSLTSQFSQMTASPDGVSLSEALTPSPTRILVDGQWQDLDMTLRSSGGTVAPVVAGNSVVLAAGGSDAPLASVAIAKDLLKPSALSFTAGGAGADVGRSIAADDPGVSLGWPSGQAPKPTLEQDGARYAGVAAGVDAVVGATPRGFGLSLEAASSLPAAATVSLPLTLAGGLVVKPTAATLAPIPVLSAAGQQVGVIAVRDG